MKKTLIALGLGLIVMAAVISFGMYVSSDLRWLYILGSTGLFAGGLLLGSRAWKGLFPWLTLCAPLSTLFALLVLRARTSPLRIPEMALLIFLWFLWGGIGFLWRARVKFPALIATLALLSFSAWFAAGFLPMAASRAMEHVQRTPAPGFALQTLDGSAIPSGEWQGKVVVFDFFSETCGPCLAELPHLEEVRRSLQHRTDIVLVLVASDLGGDTPDTIRAYMKKNNIGLRAAFDKGGKAHDAFGFMGVPALVVLDKSGNIRLSRQGYNRAEAGHFATKLASLLSSL